MATRPLPPGISPTGLPIDIPPAVQPTARNVVVLSNGLMRAASLGSVLQEQEKRAAQLRQSAPLISSLAAHVRSAFTAAYTARQASGVDARMIAGLEARRGVYSASKLTEIRKMGGSEVYANLTSVKCRAASSWLRDILMATGVDRPWTITPSPVPDVPPEADEEAITQAAGVIRDAMLAGTPLTPDQEQSLVRTLRELKEARIKVYAREAAAKMADKMEDQLLEGGWLTAMAAFIDDITVYPSAILKGPVLRRKPKLTYDQNQNSNPGATPVNSSSGLGANTTTPGQTPGAPNVSVELVVEFERADPALIWPSPGSTGPNDGYIIEKHKLTRRHLTELLGVPGYDDGAIRLVLDQHGRGGLTDWTSFANSALDTARGLASTASATSGGGTAAGAADPRIDALQFFGAVSGQNLRDFGLSQTEVPDPIREYEAEVWLIGTHVIKAVLNGDPLARRPYYAASYEDVPDNFWGRSVYDLVAPSQSIVNAVARAIVNNASIASGPQVVINTDRLAPGESITTLVPWRLWQVTTDPFGTNQKPIEFFQPESRVGELMGIFKFFSELADEYSGLPKYLVGEAGGAGRTASGLSMLMNNASRVIKQVIAGIDNNVLGPLLERLYQYNMRYALDPALKGDASVVARGASSLVAKEAAQMRRNEFLAATANPVDMQIVGVEGRAALLREAAKGLDVDTDAVVPPLDIIRSRLAQNAMAAQGQPGSAPGPGSTTVAPGGPSPSGQDLMGTGAPITDNFSPPSQ